MAYGSTNAPGKLTPSDIGAAPANHTHTPASIGAAAASHGTHVSYNTTAPTMDGTASAGSASTVARSDHRHPTDTSRAAASHTHSNYVPTTRKVNNKALSADISLTAADVGALPVSGYIKAGRKAGTYPGDYSTAEGISTTASEEASHAEGRSTTASGQFAHAEGSSTTASKEASHAEGRSTTASGQFAHAEGSSTTASEEASHAEGNDTTASGYCSHAEGFCTKASADYQHAGGTCNVEYTDFRSKFIIGSGLDALTRSNCFRVTDIGTYAAGAYNASGADYAEYFSWLDGNPEREDRVGLFVTLDGEEIRLAGPEDDYILGIVSGNPSVVGDVHDDQWQGMYLHDIYGRPLWEDVEVPDETVEEPDPEDPEQTVTRIIRPAHVEHRQRLNPAYDGSKPYQARSDRPEWDAVGMLGKLVARDDGSCQVNGWCKPAVGGIATASQERTRFRVMARLDEEHIRVMVLA